MSSNGSPRNYYGKLEVNLKTCAKGTKWRVYKYALGRDHECRECELKYKK